MIESNGGRFIMKTTNALEKSSFLSAAQLHLMKLHKVRLL